LPWTAPFLVGRLLGRPAPCRVDPRDEDAFGEPDEFDDAEELPEPDVPPSSVALATAGTISTELIPKPTAPAASNA